MFALLAAALAAPPAPPVCEYHLAVFASYREPFKPQDTHTFAAVVRVTTDPAAGARTTDMVSISWLPATLKIRGLVLKGEPGINHPLRDTIDWVKGAGLCVSAWGPFPVRPELYDLFCQRVNRLEGCIRGYKALDGLYSHSRVSNCVHGVSEAVIPHGKGVGSFGFGEKASADTLHHLSPWLLDTNAEGPEVLALFGVAECEVIRRPYGYCGPTKGQSFKSAIFKK